MNKTESPGKATQPNANQTCGLSKKRITCVFCFHTLRLSSSSSLPCIQHRQDPQYEHPSPTAPAPRAGSTHAGAVAPHARPAHARTLSTSMLMTRVSVTSLFCINFSRSCALGVTEEGGDERGGGGGGGNESLQASVVEGAG